MEARVPLPGERDTAGSAEAVLLLRSLSACGTGRCLPVRGEGSISSEPRDADPCSVASVEGECSWAACWTAPLSLRTMAPTGVEKCTALVEQVEFLVGFLGVTLRELSASFDSGVLRPDTFSDTEVCRCQETAPVLIAPPEFQMAVSPAVPGDACCKTPAAQEASACPG